MPDAPKTTIDLNQNRVIILSGEIDEDKSKMFIERLITLECHNPHKDILICIDSYGGYIDSFIAMHDAIRMLRCDVATLCLGKAMSAGIMLLMSGAKGKRFITPNARTLMHELSAGTCGKLADIEIDVKEFHRLQKVLENLVSKYTKLRRTEIKKFMERDTFFDAQETLRIGVVDKIVNNGNELYRDINL